MFKSNYISNAAFTERWYNLTFTSLFFGYMKQKNGAEGVHNGLLRERNRFTLCLFKSWTCLSPAPPLRPLFCWNTPGFDRLLKELSSLMLALYNLGDQIATVPTLRLKSTILFMSMGNLLLWLLSVVQGWGGSLRVNVNNYTYRS